MSELARSVSGEIDAVPRAQPPDLTFEVRPLRGIPSLLVDETVPDIDVADVDLLGLLTIEPVEIGRIGQFFDLTGGCKGQMD